MSWHYLQSLLQENCKKKKDENLNRNSPKSWWNVDTKKGHQQETENLLVYIINPNYFFP